MSLPILLMHSASICGLALVAASLFRSRQSVAKWLFISGMFLLAGQTALVSMGLGVQSTELRKAFLMGSILTSAISPSVWLAFSLVYARGNYAEFLARWRWILIGLGALFVGLVVAVVVYPIEPVFEDGRPTGEFALGSAVRFLSAVQVFATLLILVNLERTLRESIGTMRWRIKFLILGLFIIFGSQIYTRTQWLLFPVINFSLAVVSASALLVGGALMTVTFVRMGREDVEIYPSRAVLSGSISVILVGGYLLAVGVLAHLVSYFGRGNYFEIQTVLVLLALAGLGVFLLSARFKQAVRVWVGRHFARPTHDFRRLWRLFTQRIADVRDEEGLAMETVKLTGETLEALSATVWLVDERGERVYCAATSSELQRTVPPEALQEIDKATIRSVCSKDEPFNLDKARGDWAEAVRNICPKQFKFCGDRMCAPIVVGERNLGFLVLGDRVRGLPFTVEELDFLKCVADHAAVGILNFRLANELTAAKQLEAFQAMSTFFIHDLKNAAHGLNLTMTNLPDHFDDPEFRQDALKSISRISERISSIVGRLNVLRNKLDLNPVETDLNDVVERAIRDFQPGEGITLEQSLKSIPKVRVDREQFQAVVTNLVINARDALSGSGVIHVETARNGANAILSVTDTGCGMADEFIQKSLFRPFRTTKKAGMGIGLFHTKVLVEAHHGAIEVDSAPGRGTTFKVILPFAN